MIIITIILVIIMIIMSPCALMFFGQKPGCNCGISPSGLEVKGDSDTS